MSLTSYRAAPSRANQRCWDQNRKAEPSARPTGRRALLAREPRPRMRPPASEANEQGEWVFRGIRIVRARAAMPGDDLLFHRLSDSTIGAVWFHGRVRDGIGWFTDAIATRQWSPCGRKGDQIDTVHWYFTTGRDDHPHRTISFSRAVIDGGTHQARTGQLVPVSSTRYRASTSGLSRSWSSTVLRNLISREASRLDAFSGYPVHT